MNAINFLHKLLLQPPPQQNLLEKSISLLGKVITLVENIVAKPCGVLVVLSPKFVTLTDQVVAVLLLPLLLLLLSGAIKRLSYASVRRSQIHALFLAQVTREEAGKD